MITQTHDFAFPDTYPVERLGKLEELLFFDIETTGFSGDYSRLYLIGCVYYRQGSWQLIQWFADTKESEEDILREFLKFAKGFSTLVHYNGDRFDIPFIQKRCEFYGSEWKVSGFVSIDIYKRIRPYRKILALDSLKQKSIERFLGIFREDRYSGGELIEVYSDYLATREDRLYDMLMLHNREDLEGMPLILPILCYPDFLEGEFVLEAQQLLTQTDIFGEEDLSLRITVKSEEAVPVPVEWQTSCGAFEVQDNMLIFTVPLFRGTLKYFYPDYKDYYYLPYEDRAIHKSVGTYVERQARRQAKANTCYTHRTSLFLPQPGELWTPSFRKEYKDKSQYAEYKPEMFHDHGKLMAYLSWAVGVAGAGDKEEGVKKEEVKEAGE